LARDWSTLNRKQKALLSALVIGVLGGVTSLGVFGLFSATTQNAGNEITTGTVTFTDNDAGSALYNLTGSKPGDTVTRCIKASYTGSLPANVRLYANGTPGPLAQYIDLQITKGTQASSTFPDCAGFTADPSGAVFTGTLQGFEQQHGNFTDGIATAPAGQANWQSGDARVYRIQATLQSSTPNSGQGATSGPHAYVWEARSE
jgi:hypothetical protein